MLESKFLGNTTTLQRNCKRSFFNMYFLLVLFRTNPEDRNILEQKMYNSACAAAGQLGLMSLYSTMFQQYGVATSQLLLTSFDFSSPERCHNVRVSNFMQSL